MLFRELLTQGQIRPLEDDPEEDPLQVKDEREKWDEDESPLLLLKLIEDSEKTREELKHTILQSSYSHQKGSCVTINYQTYIIRLRLS